MRAVILATILLVSASAAALADGSVAGDWKADLGGNVVINMTVSPDGKWSSETLQSNKAVRQMKGVYKQTPKDDGHGTIVFTPTQAKVKSGSVKPEIDAYEVADNGQRLKLTSHGDTMVFDKQDHH